MWECEFSLVFDFRVCSFKSVSLHFIMSSSNVNETPASAAVNIEERSEERSEPRVDVPEGVDQAMSSAGKYFAPNKITGNSSVGTRSDGGT